MQRLFPVLGRRAYSIRTIPKLAGYASIPQDLYHTSKDPIFNLLHNLSSSSTSLDIQHEPYKPVVRSSSITDALPLIKSVPPTWLVMHIIANKIHTPAHASLTVPLLRSSLPGASTELKPLLIILTVAQLATHNILTALPSLIQELILLSPSAMQCNLMLHVLTRSNAPQPVLPLLEHMRIHGYALDTATYHRLLSSRSTTLALSNLLSQRMASEGKVPDLQTLTGFMKMFGKHGDIRRARQYRTAVLRFLQSERGEQQKKSKNVNWAVVQTTRSKSVAPAFQYLSSFHLSPSSSLLPSPVSTTHLTSLLSLASHSPQITPAQLISIYHTIPQPTIATFTSLIDGLVRKGAYSEASSLWDSGISHSNNDEEGGNQKRWNIGHIDDAALSVGLRALVRAGRPGSAFSLLSHVIVLHLRARGRLAPEGAQSHPASGPIEGVHDGTTCTIERDGAFHLTRSRRGKHRSLRISIHTINSLLVSLIRTTPSRPDIVYLVWDHMHKLYAVIPNNNTLDILFQAARIGYKEDRRTLRGNLREFALQLPSNPFRRRRTESNPLTRKEILTLIRTTCDQPPKALSIWRDTSAFNVVIKIFMSDILLRNYPHLAYVLPPAKAIRSVEGDTAPWANLVHVAKGLYAPFAKSKSKSSSSSSPGRSSTWIAPEGEEPHWDAPYPSIIPTEQHFASFLAILALSSSAHLIPTLLAYMRVLRITPKPRTLGYALILFSPYASRGPLLDHLAGEEDEYIKLIRWCVDWVGEERMPRHEMFWHYRMELRGMLDPFFLHERNKRLSRDQRGTPPPESVFKLRGKTYGLKGIKLKPSRTQKRTREEIIRKSLTRWTRSKVLRTSGTWGGHRKLRTIWRMHVSPPHQAM